MADVESVFAAALLPGAPPEQRWSVSQGIDDDDVLALVGKAVVGQWA